MHLMYTLDANGKRLYTLSKVRGLSSYGTFTFPFIDTDTPAFGQVQAGEVTKSAHPARFSPDDKYSSKAILSPAIGNLGEADRDNLHRTSGHSEEALWAALDSE